MAPPDCRHILQLRLTNEGRNALAGQVPTEPSESKSALFDGNLWPLETDWRENHPIGVGFPRPLRLRPGTNQLFPCTETFPDGAAHTYSSRLRLFPVVRLGPCG